MTAYGNWPLRTFAELVEKAEQASWLEAEVEALKAENERLWNGLLAIETRTKGCGEGTTAGEVYKIARYARLPHLLQEQGEKE